MDQSKFFGLAMVFIIGFTLYTVVTNSQDISNMREWCDRKDGIVVLSTEGYICIGRELVIR